MRGLLVMLLIGFRSCYSLLFVYLGYLVLVDFRKSLSIVENEFFYPSCMIVTSKL